MKMTFRPKELNLRIWDKYYRAMTENPKKIDFRNKNFVLMQSAGQDCHESIVYEGDMLLLDERQYVYVMFCYQCEEFKLHDFDGMCLCCDHQDDSPIHEGELAGNIYEDSMLLWNEITEDFARQLREQND